MNCAITNTDSRFPSRRRIVSRNLASVRRAFTLIEVMIALGIFFIAMFAILGLVSNSLRSARALQRKTVDCGIVAAQLSITNDCEEGLQSGDFENLYPDFQWVYDKYEVATNGLYQADILVQRRGGGAIESKMSILLFYPNCRGSLSKGRL